MKEKVKRENVDEKTYKGTVGRDVSKVNELGSANKGIERRREEGERQIIGK